MTSVSTIPVDALGWLGCVWTQESSDCIYQGSSSGCLSSAKGALCLGRLYLFRKYRKYQLGQKASPPSVENACQRDLLPMFTARPTISIGDLHQLKIRRYQIILSRLIQSIGLDLLEKLQEGRVLSWFDEFYHHSITHLELLPKIPSVYIQHLSPFPFNKSEPPRTR